jgi:hypothetical protein
VPDRIHTAFPPPGDAGDDVVALAARAHGRPSRPAAARRRAVDVAEGWLLARGWHVTRVAVSAGRD